MVKKYYESFYYTSIHSNKMSNSVEDERNIKKSLRFFKWSLPFLKQVIYIDKYSTIQIYVIQIRKKLLGLPRGKKTYLLADDRTETSFLLLAKHLISPCKFIYQLNTKRNYLLSFAGTKNSIDSFYSSLNICSEMFGCNLKQPVFKSSESCL